MIKTIVVYNDTIEFDKEVNDFEKTQSVFAIQTHVSQVKTHEGTATMYTAVIFYKVRL
jgi:hypothetical protein